MSATKQEPEMTFENAAAMGLSKEEWELILTRLGRTPNMCELGIFSAMWSEHCSYKSSKKWLKTLPIDGPQVIEGPGENAGAIDIGDGLAAIFKIESHNHPSPSSSHIRARQQASAAFFAMSSPWARGRLRC